MANEDIEKLIVQFGARFDSFQREMLKLNGVTDREARKIERRFQALNRNIAKALDARNLASGLGRILGVAGIGLGTKEVIAYADAWTRSRAQLQVAGVETDRLATKQDELLNIANRSRTDFETIVSLYQRLGIASRELGTTQGDLTRITETLAKALQLGGASASEAQAAMLQFSQAVASGVLQGDELRSIRENAPLVAQAIADEFGTTVGQLKELGAAGELEGGRILKAILRVGADINSEFEKLPRTADQSFTRLGNSITALIGKLSEATGATAKLAGFFETLGDAIDLSMDKTLEGRLKVVQSVIKTIQDANENALITKVPLLGDSFIKENLERLKTLQEEEAEILRKLNDQRNMQTSNREGKGPLPSSIDPVTFQKLPSSGAKPTKDRSEDVLTALRFEEQQLQRTSREQEIYNQLQRASVDISSQYGRTIADLAGKIYDAELAKRVFESNQERIQQMQTEAQTMGLTAEAADYLATKEEMLNEFRREGIAITPELTARIEAEAQAMAKAAGNAEEMQRIADVNDTVKESFKGLLTDIASGVNPVDALTDALGRLADKLLDLALDDMFNSFMKPGGATAGGSGGGMFAGLFHGGGVAGSARSGRRVSPLAFAGAPRYHGGGIAGIKPGEVPAILKRGEPILPSMGALKAIAGSRQGDNRIIVNNNNGSTVRASRDSNGVTRIDIDDQIASLLSDRNSKVSRALEVSRGARIPPKVR